MRCAKNIEILIKHIIPGFENLKLRNCEPNKINADLMKAVEKFNVFKVKFDELNRRIKKSEFDGVDDLLIKAIEPIVEFYVI